MWCSSIGRVFQRTSREAAVLLTRQVQRCGVSSLRVPAVDVFWRTQLLHSCQAAFLCSVQQSSIAPQQVLDVGVPVFDHVQWDVAIAVLLGRVGSVLRERHFCVKPKQK